MNFIQMLTKVTGSKIDFRIAIMQFKLDKNVLNKYQQFHSHVSILYRILYCQLDVDINLILETVDCFQTRWIFQYGYVIVFIASEFEG